MINHSQEKLDKAKIVLDEYEKYLYNKYTAYMSYGTSFELLTLAKLKYPYETKYTDMTLEKAINNATNAIKEKP